MKRKGKIILGVVVAVLVCGLCICAAPAMKKAVDTAIIKIPARADYNNIKDSLTKYQGEEYATAVVNMMKVMRPDLNRRHGAYTIEFETPAYQAARILARGAQTPLTITITGFRSANDLKRRIAARFDFSLDSLNRTLSDSLLLSYGLAPEQTLALFINDSYQYYWSDSPREVVGKIGRHYNDVWNQQRRELADSLNLSPAQVMILASIIDEETNKVDEKGKVAQVYMNRLKRGMKLQADPTIRFALGDFSIKRVREEHLKVQSPYNTYLNYGLPPAPIRTTSVETIDAILNSEPSDAIYMCAKEDFSGYHNFANSYEQHLKNARAYRAALDSIGIQ